jgi:uncharacterized protein
MIDIAGAIDVAGRGASSLASMEARKPARWPSKAMAKLAAVAAARVLLLASTASAGALSEGERAYARHDYVRAAPLLRIAAEGGSPIAQTYLGHMYEEGLGVPKNYVAAAGWLQLAAVQGEPTAQFLLGLLFNKGFGVPEDWVQAEVWLNLATSHAAPGQRDYWTRVRDGVAQKLTLDQAAEAQRRAYLFAPIVGGPAISARY